MRTAQGTPRVLRNPNVDDLRSYIAAQKCWWCGREDLRVLAGHTSKAHGISAADLREMAGMIKGARICDERHGEACSDRAIRLHKEGRIPTPPACTHRRYSSAGLAVQRAKIAKMQVISADRRRILRTCAICGRNYSSRYGNKTCGLSSCEHKLRSSHGQPRGGTVKANCSVCGDEYEVFKSGPRVACYKAACVAVVKVSTARSNQVSAVRKVTADPALRRERSERMRRYGQQNADRTRKPHPCTNAGCDVVVPVATRKTCSPECRRDVRVRTAVASARTRRERAGVSA